MLTRRQRHLFGHHGGGRLEGAGRFVQAAPSRDRALQIDDPGVISSHAMPPQRRRQFE